MFMIGRKPSPHDLHSADLSDWMRWTSPVNGWPNGANGHGRSAALVCGEAEAELHRHLGLTARITPLGGARGAGAQGAAGARGSVVTPGSRQQTPRTAAPPGHHGQGGRGSATGGYGMR